MSDRRPDPEMPLLAATYRELQGPGSDACPPTEALAALAVGERKPESENVADHVVSCRRCADDMQVLLRTRAEMSTASLRSSRARPWLLAAAAALALVAASLFLIRRGPGPSAPASVERGAAESGDRVTPIAGARLDRPPEELAWPAQDGADAYRVRIFTMSGSLLWESPTGAEARVTLPSEPAAHLRSGESYFWVVEVLPSLDHRRLGPFRFSIR